MCWVSTWCQAPCRMFPFIITRGRACPHVAWYKSGTHVVTTREHGNRGSLGSPGSFLEIKPPFKEEKDIPGRRETGPKLEVRKEFGCQGPTVSWSPLPAEFLIPSETVGDSGKSMALWRGGFSYWLVSPLEAGHMGRQAPDSA